MSDSIYVRTKGEKGWRYRRIKEGRGIRTGDLQGPFYVRPSIAGKQVWRPLAATTFRNAKEETKLLEQGEQTTNANRVSIKGAIETYLDQKTNKTKRTRLQYENALTQFLEAVGARVHFLDEIKVDTLRQYKRWMETQGYKGKTIDTRLNIVYFLLKKNSISVRLPRDEMPVVEEEPAVPYSEEELKKLFAAMNEEETIRYKFFLGTGCRDKEVTFASWADVDLDKRTYTIRSKPDGGFTVKNHESRTVPLPDSLIRLLKARKEKRQHPRWIFVNDEGRPDNHFLRKLKRIALHTGLNCNQCKTTLTLGKYDRKRKVEVSCETQPVCEHIKLHRFRKTCATRWQEAGIPIRTIQAWLGHKELETTMLYLGVTGVEKLRDHINRAFGN